MTDETKRTRRQRIADPQMLRLSAVVDALAAMGAKEREDAIGYILRRFAAKPEPPAAEPEPAPAPPTPNAPGSDRTM